MAHPRFIANGMWDAEINALNYLHGRKQVEYGTDVGIMLTNVLGDARIGALEMPMFKIKEERYGEPDQFAVHYAKLLGAR